MLFYQLMLLTILIGNSSLPGQHRGITKAFLCTIADGPGDSQPLPKGYIYAPREQLRLFVETSYPLRERSLRIFITGPRNEVIWNHKMQAFTDVFLLRAEPSNHLKYDYVLPNTLKSGQYKINIEVEGPSLKAKEATVEFDVAGS